MAQAKIDLVELKAAAEKATPGPWQTDRAWATDEDGVAYQTANLEVLGPTLPFRAYEPDGVHIANCDPQTILALIEAVEEAIEVNNLTCNLGCNYLPDVKLRDALAPFTE